MIYFDNASTTKVNKLALDDYFNKALNFYANPNSIHHLGMEVSNLIFKEKEKVLKILNLNPKEYDVIYTSSATESNNLALVGYALANINRGKHIITSKVEHASVLEPLKVLEKKHGFKISYVKINEDGSIDLEDFNKLITKDTILVSLMKVNNEVGINFDLNKVKEIISKYPKCVLHSDLAQACGKVELDCSLFDMMTISSHKINGLKSIAVLIKKKRVKLEPIIYGGGQQFNLRSGTEDYPLISSFTVALNEYQRNLKENLAKVHLIFDFLVNELSKINQIKLHLYPNQCEYILNFSLEDKKASVVVEALSLKEIYVSSVSACSSKKEEPSYVLLALNKSLKEANNSIRLSFNKDNTIQECEIFINTLKDILSNIRG